MRACISQGCVMKDAFKLQLQATAFLKKPIMGIKSQDVSESDALILTVFCLIFKIPQQMGARY